MDSLVSFYREDRAGIQFRMGVLVVNVSTCEPIANAVVDLWHCDSLGLYSHYIQASQNVPSPQNDNQTFLRGISQTVFFPYIFKAADSSLLQKDDLVHI